MSQLRYNSIVYLLQLTHPVTRHLSATVTESVTWGSVDVNMALQVMGTRLAMVSIIVQKQVVFWGSEGRIIKYKFIYL